MASYHFSAKIIQRSKGESSVAAAAYRAGQRLRDDRADRIHDYSRRRGVVFADILLPHGAASSLKDRQQLWTLVERMEGRKDAQLAREITLALPHEPRCRCTPRTAYNVRPGSLRRPRYGRRLGDP
ncbi:MobA/MobL family protein [Bradyrhizobium guangxiense]